METCELYLKTLFCCSACDGEIASEEISLVKSLSEKEKLFENMDVESILNTYVNLINAQGKMFLKSFLRELAETSLTDEEQIKLIELSIKMIEADNQILYSEVKFFKKMRGCLNVSDECILAVLPNSEEYLLPDIMSEDKDLEDVGNFSHISFA
ncbi:MAG: TerB family tellurite resistance protein [Muribaculaceae bacterium]|nr:TerB family tellurite resistance protein [Muribaculaceae bacterium]